MRRPAWRAGTCAFLAALSIAAAPPAMAGETTVAVAANFTAAASEIGEAFSGATGHSVTYSFGSTGQLFSQISQGAPFEVFLAADTERPAKAVAEGYAVEGSSFTYAVGRLALWSADPDRITGDGAELLMSGEFNKIAIANPATAPYGAAAVAVMRALGVFAALEPKIVQGNSIAQTHQFVASGAADVGFVAMAQIALDGSGSRWDVPAELYAPIRQDAVLLVKGVDNAAAAAFLAFLKSPTALAIIERYGYGNDPGQAS